MHEALQELQACAGTQYDPAIVGAFEQAVAEGRIRLP
jgi:HD-GYP domain-containing protein (c-di-GMP phosphodiesterase class II)